MCAFINIRGLVKSPLDHPCRPYIWVESLSKKDKVNEVIFSRKVSDRQAKALPRPSLSGQQFRWLPSGEQALAEMLEAIDAARHSISLEVYIFQPGELGEKFRTSLIAAARRQVRVRVLIDAFGSYTLADDFWADLTAAGGECRRFKLPGIRRFGLRDHRKLLLCDERRAFINGLNIGPEYAGDGVRQGWRDLGLHLDGDLARHLSLAFEEMFSLANFQRRRFTWVRHAIRHRRIESEQAIFLLSAPGWRRNPMVRLLVHDFSHAKTISILAAYFLPTPRVMRSLLRAARRGAKVRLILAGRSDMALMQMATHGLYRRLLQAGIEIYEYQPQILHAKMIIVDDKVVYAGSANLDVRSLHLNYELLARVENQRLAQEAAAIFQGDLDHSQPIKFEEWARARTWWGRLLSRAAFFLLARLDPYLASGSWRR